MDFFSRLFFSFLLVLAIILVGLFAFHRFYLLGSFAGEIQKQNMEILTQIQRRLDNDITAMRRIAFSVSFNPVFSPFDLERDMARAIQTISILQNYTLILPDSNLIGIAYDQFGYVLTNLGSFKKGSLFAGSFLTYSGMIREENFEQGFIVLEDMVLFVFPYRNNSNSPRQGVFFIQYPRKGFINKFTLNLSKNQRFLAIRSNVSGNVLLSNNNLPDTETSREVFVSETTGFTYEIATPLSYYRSFMFRFQIQSLLAVTVFFGLGLVLSFLLARYNASPLWKIIRRYGLPVTAADFSGIERILEEQQAKQERAAYDTAFRNLAEGKINGSGAPLVNSIKKYIEGNYTDKMMSLESIADYLGFSVGYLSRFFKKKTGITIAAYIHGLRVKAACKLLSSTVMPVKDIVFQIGYLDHSSFSRSFKAQTGLSPQEYRLLAAEKAT